MPLLRFPSCFLPEHVSTPAPPTVASLSMTHRNPTKRRLDLACPQSGASNPAPTLSDVVSSGVENSGELYTVAILQTLATGNGNQVFKAELHISGGEERFRVICKVASSLKCLEALRTEGHFYTTSLLRLQGHVVPNFFGLFEGTVGELSVGVLILQYCGPSLDIAFEYHSLPTRQKIFSAMAAIHEAGVEHGDFNEGNILCDDKRHIWVIDFGHAHTHKGTCALFCKSATFYDKNRSIANLKPLGCEICLVTQELCMFYQGVFGGVEVTREKLPSTTADELVLRISNDYGYKDPYDSASRFLKEYIEWLKKRQAWDEEALEAEMEEDRQKQLDRDEAYNYEDESDEGDSEEENTDEDSDEEGVEEGSE
ncbi:hypothetical protein OH76DRAFT_1487022 [Lentinus brumalis]|uniref:non-specific serine/threonine protein kinase n=1 Tax=Lentinus brumalis TaxID=2498619 RepID=A0A371CWF0_9APHY|nr:hypothetical protein OH76DRAFT_1487022 [Polyporus brumalis]